ncbi:hypothetical protein KDK_43680 [Dictyobacter kobayashii]|uniref:Uncharacterized protein n=1 Tax=Dictyobacter kobayashii TaxID=2014872 RepID=A0A402AMZ5_9CHLR|nr:hypothetical protein KDK_43680 [Dictyobacter kobayashii]
MKEDKVYERVMILLKYTLFFKKMQYINNNRMASIFSLFFNQGIGMILHTGAAAPVLVVW